MRIGVIALGLIIIFAGLILTSTSRNAVTIKNENRELVATGPIDVPEISNVNLNKSEKYVVTYSGGGTYVNPDEIVVNVFDPLGSLTTVNYTTEFNNGIIANSTGSYKIELGAPGLINPEYPFQLIVRKIVVTTNIEYPNSNLLPYGLAALVIGAGISLLGARSQRRKTTRRQKMRDRIGQKQMK